MADLMDPDVNFDYNVDQGATATQEAQAQQQAAQQAAQQSSGQSSSSGHSSDNSSSSSSNKNTSSSSNTSSQSIDDQINAKIKTLQDALAEASGYKRDELAQQLQIAIDDRNARQQVAQTSADASKYGADQNLAGTKYASDNSLKGSEYSSDNSLKGTEYSADQSLAGTTLASNNSLAGTKYSSDNSLAGTKYSADQSLAGTTLASNNSLKGTEYSADQGLAGTKYASDNSLAGTKYASDNSTAASEYGSNNNLYGTLYSANQGLLGTEYSADAGERNSQRSLQGTEYSADQGLTGTKYSADSSRAASEYGSNLGLEGSLYGSDTSAANTQYTTDADLYKFNASQPLQRAQLAQTFLQNYEAMASHPDSFLQADQFARLGSQTEGMPAMLQDLLGQVNPYASSGGNIAFTTHDTSQLPQTAAQAIFGNDPLSLVNTREATPDMPVYHQASLQTIGNGQDPTQLYQTQNPQYAAIGTANASQNGAAPVVMPSWVNTNPLDTLHAQSLPTVGGTPISNSTGNAWTDSPVSSGGNTAPSYATEGSPSSQADPNAAIYAAMGLNAGAMKYLPGGAQATGNDGSNEGARYAVDPEDASPQASIMGSPAQYAVDTSSLRGPSSQAAPMPTSLSYNPAAFSSSTSTNGVPSSTDTSSLRGMNYQGAPSANSVPSSTNTQALRGPSSQADPNATQDSAYNPYASYGQPSQPTLGYNSAAPVPTTASVGYYGSYGSPSNYGQQTGQSLDTSNLRGSYNQNDPSNQTSLPSVYGTSNDTSNLRGSYNQNQASSYSPYGTSSTYGTGSTGSNLSSSYGTSAGSAGTSAGASSNYSMPNAISSLSTPRALTGQIAPDQSQDDQFLSGVQQAIANGPQQWGNQALEKMTSTEKDMFSSGLKASGLNPDDVYTAYARSRIGDSATDAGRAA